MRAPGALYLSYRNSAATGPHVNKVQQPGDWSSLYVLAEFVCDLQLHREVQFTGTYGTGATTHLSRSHP